jgi:hypothetical protein
LVLLVRRPKLTVFLFPILYRSEPWRRRLAHFYLGLSVLWTAFALTTTLGDYIGARVALAFGDFTVAEGAVTDFRSTKRGDESFVVGGKRFSYSDHTAAAGFNNTRSHGGPISDGLYVRITHRGNQILRLEVRR